MRVAVYGGSFDPPHVSHVLAVSYVLACERVDLVLVMPVYCHAFEKRLTPFVDRLRMCELALDWIPRVEVSDLEATLQVPSLTLRTVQQLQRAHPNYELRLMVGADVLEEASQWHRFDEVTRLAPLLVLGRVGVDTDCSRRAILPDISSTEVRALLARRGCEEVDGQLRQLVPSPVLDYIQARQLYWDG